MDTLSIFVIGDLDWHQFIQSISHILDSAGEDISDDDSRRHQWLVDDFEITAIADPKYENDCGIPFTDYSHQVVIVDANATFEKCRIRQYTDLAKSLTLAIDSIIPNDLVVVKNLQSFVSI